MQKQLGHKSLLAASVYQRVHDTPAKLAADQAIKVMQQFADKPVETKITNISIVDDLKVLTNDTL